MRGCVSYLFRCWGRGEVTDATQSGFEQTSPEPELWLNSARQLIARQSQTVEVAEHGHSDGFRMEEFVRQLLNVVHCRARLDIRAVDDSSDSIRLPFN
jgi:hypothetical protein